MNINNNQELEALCARLLPKFFEYLQAHSKNIFDCELATSLDGINSMPALYDKAGVRKQVIAPISLLSSEATQQAQAATTQAQAATTQAQQAQALAEELSTHPMKAGDNGNWQQWNTETQQYDDLGIKAKIDSDLQSQVTTLSNATANIYAGISKPYTVLNFQLTSNVDQNLNIVTANRNLTYVVDINVHDIGSSKKTITVNSSGTDISIYDCNSAHTMSAEKVTLESYAVYRLVLCANAEEAVLHHLCNSDMQKNIDNLSLMVASIDSKLSDLENRVKDL